MNIFRWDLYMGPYESKSLKTLPLLQLTAEKKPFLNFRLSGPHKTTFCILKF